MQPYTILECGFFHYTHCKIKETKSRQNQIICVRQRWRLNLGPSNSQLLPFATMFPPYVCRVPCLGMPINLEKAKKINTWPPILSTVGNMHVDNVEYVHGQLNLQFSVFQTMILLTFHQEPHPGSWQNLTFPRLL